MNDVTRQFVRNIAGTESFSRKTIAEAKKAIIDTVGCMIAGVRSPIGRTAIEVLGGFGGVGEATILGDGRKLPAPIAAYVTGQCCAGPDLSDNYKPGTIIISHPGEGVIPAVLAMAERTAARLEDLLRATILGYETAGRYAMAIEPRRPEVYSFSTHYTLAAAIGCAQLLGLNQDQTVNALGIAGTIAPLPVTMAMWGFKECQRPASWHRDMPGHACFAGVLASLFAQTDFKATHLLLERETDYFKIAGSDNYDPQKLFQNWGKSFVIDAIAYKAIPSCYFNQPCIEAVRLLLEEYGLQIGQIDKIDIYAPTILAENFSHYPPQTSVDTASSVKYLTAMYLLTENPGPDWYLEFERYLDNDAYLNISDKIEVHTDEALQKILQKNNRLCARATVRVGETVYEKQASFVKGSPENPFSMEEIEAKFLRLSAPVVGAKRAEGFLNAIQTGDGSQPVRRIVAELRVA